MCDKKVFYTFEVKPEEFKGELTLNDLFLIVCERIHIQSGSIIFILHVYFHSAVKASVYWRRHFIIIWSGFYYLNISESDSLITCLIADVLKVCWTCIEIFYWGAFDLNSTSMQIQITWRVLKALMWNYWINPIIMGWSVSWFYKIR